MGELCMPINLMHHYPWKEMQMAMAWRCFHLSWTCSLNPSSTDIQVGCTLWALIYENFPSYPFLQCFSFFTTTFIFYGMPLEGQPSEWFVSTSNFFPKRKNKHYMLITNLQEGLTKIQFRSHLPVWRILVRKSLKYIQSSSLINKKTLTNIQKRVPLL